VSLHGNLASIELDCELCDCLQICCLDGHPLGQLLWVIHNYSMSAAECGAVGHNCHPSKVSHGRESNRSKALYTVKLHMKGEAQLLAVCESF